MSIFTVRLESA